MIQIPVALLEFCENGNTVWIQSPNGATVMRIKTLGKLSVGNRECENVCSHADVVTPNDIEFCLAGDAGEEGYVQ